MKNHIKVDGKLYQTNKRYKDLKLKQKEKIVQWMYEAYVFQIEKHISDYEAIDSVYEKIEEAEIWIPYDEVEKKYRSKKKDFKKRYEKQVMQ